MIFFPQVIDEDTMENVHQKIPLMKIVNSFLSQEIIKIYIFSHIFFQLIIMIVWVVLTHTKLINK